MKKMLSVILAIIMFAGLVTPASAIEWTDEAKTEDAIDDVPMTASADACTRGEWIAKLVSALGLNITEDEYPDNYFTDVADDQNYASIMTAVKFGLIDVEAGDAFEPEGPLTREFAAHTANFYLGFIPENEEYSFLDSTETKYPADAQIAVTRGWFELSGDKFLPQAQVTDSEIETILADAKEVLNGVQAGESKSSYTFAAGVKEIAKGTQVEIDGDTVTIYASPDELQTGDLFAVYIDNIALVYKAVSVDKSKEDITVVTAGEAPENSILSAESSGTMPVDLAEGFVPSDDTTSIVLTSGEIMTIGPARIAARKNDRINVSRTVKVGDAIKGSISADISNVDLDYSLGSRSWFTVDGDMDLSVSISVDVMKLTGNTDAVHLVLGSINLGVGKIECSVDINLKGQVSYSSTMEFRVGLEYSDGFRPITNINKKSYTISAEAELSAMLATSLNVNLGVLKCNGWFKVGPIMTFNMKQHSDGTPKQCVTIGGYLYAGAYLGGSFNLGRTKKSYNKNIEIFTARNSPIRTSQHWEDNVEVTSCTRGADTGIKYVSPANTRYASSGQRNYSTGSGGSGSGGVTSTWEYTTDSNTGEAAITKYTGTASAVTVPETIDGHTVTKIGDKAFYENSTLRSVVIPDTVLTIGSNAFYRCGNLKTVSFGEKIQIIEDYAFRETGITYARLPEGLEELGAGVFYNCPSLTGAYIPSTLKRASTLANFGGGTDFGNFAMCPNFDNVTFGEGVTAIPEHLFHSCTSLTRIEIPETVTSINTCAFLGCTGLVEVTIPEYVTTIKSSAFSGCTNLKTVNFNTYLNKIEDYAFRETGITYAKLSEGLTELGSGVFSNCQALTGAYIPSTLVKAIAYSGTYGGIFSFCPLFDNVTFGQGIKTIPSYLFEDCTSLTHIEIPTTVTSIENSAFMCSGLTSIEIPESVTSIGTTAFKQSTKLQSVTIHGKITMITNNTFEGCTSLSDVILPDGVTSISTSAFENCTALKNISWLPYTVTTIGSSAFEGCTGLTDATIPDYVTSLGSEAFRNCSKLQTVTTGAGLLTMGSYCFQGCKELSKLRLNEGLTEIASYAFQGCEALTDVVIPDTVTKIGTYCFQGSKVLKSVKLSKGLTEIPQYAFANCVQLSEIVIPKGVKTIGAHAFEQDILLKTVEIPQTVTSIGTNAFSYASSTTVRGVAGSYAQTQTAYNWKEFINIEKSAQSVTFAGGASELVLGKGQTVTPAFEIWPVDSTDVVTEMKSDSTNVTVNTKNMTLYGSKAGDANITVTTSSGKTYTLKVTVAGKLTGIETARLPDKVSYMIGEEKDMSGLEVYAVYDDGSRQRVYDYTVSHFTTDTIGTRTVTVTYAKMTAAFPVTVIDKEGNGSMGSAQELKWQVDQNTKTVTVNGSVEKTDKVIAVAYDENGRMISAYALNVGGEGVTIDMGYDQLNILWLDDASNPKCENSVIASEA